MKNKEKTKGKKVNKSCFINDLILDTAIILFSIIRMKKKNGCIRGPHGVIILFHFC